MAKLLLVLLLAAPPLLAQSSRPSEAETEAHRLTFCDLAANPAAFDHELIRITAFVSHGFENFTLSDPSCSEQREHFQVWLTYGGKTQSSTVYCCPGEDGREPRSRPLTVEDIQVPLQTDQTFEQFTNLLKAETDTTARATLVGRFFAGGKETGKDSTYWRGYGHMGCCSLFVIQSVEAFDPHTKTGLDYSAEAGWYEKEGCEVGSLRWLKHISVSDVSSAKFAIREQEQADSGERAWTFADSAKVAQESLKPYFEERIPTLRNVKHAPGRQVFRWRDGKKLVVVVVTRPYWLSFYAKSQSVAWIATMVKEGECN